MSTWEDRMAARAAERRVAAEAERERLEAEEQARLAVEFPAVEGEDDYVETRKGHYGHRMHAHPQHGNYEVCSCGATGGAWSVGIDPGYPYEPPGPCPVCAARGIARG